MLLVMIGLSSAAFIVTLNAPVTNVNQSSTSTLFNFSVVGNSSSYGCYVYTNTTGSWAASSDLFTVTNNTVQTYTKGLATGYVHKWNVLCTGTTDTNYSSTNRTINKVDTPTITINTPNNSYFGAVQTLNFTISGLGNKVCELTLDGTLNRTNTTTSDVLVHNVSLATGAHSYSLACNSSALVNTVSDTNSLTVDSTAPAKIACKTPVNLTRQADRTPTFVWNATTDTNFANYSLTYSNDSTFATGTTVAITSSSTVSYTVSDLNYDQTYYWFVEAYDSRGNYINATNCTSATPMQYTPMSICSELHAGWNLCGWTRATGLNMSAIASEIGSSITQVARWNTTDHTFDTHVVGEAGNADIKINRGDGVFIYANTTVNWSSNTFVTNTTLGNFTFSNTSSDHWSVYPVLVPTGTGFFYNLTIGNAGKIITCSYYNNTGNNYYPMYLDAVANNATPLRMGEALWCEKNTSMNPFAIVRVI